MKMRNIAMLIAFNTLGIIDIISAVSRSTGYNPCDAKDLRVTAERPVALSGRWLSHRCEVRSGPQFLLRDYEFVYNTSFILHQYYYSDGCVTPLYSLSIRGVLNEMKKSWMVPGAIDVDYTLSKVTVMPYTRDQADVLQAAVLKVCPLARFSAFPWAPYDEQEIFSFELYPTVATTVAENAGVSRIDLEFDCLEALNFTFDELNLIRIQKRRWNASGNSTSSVKELFTGETPRKPLLDGSFDAQRPVSYFADHLLKMDLESADCSICHLVENAKPSTPPVIKTQNTQPFLLSDLTGEWRSLAECESRPSGSFIKRILILQPSTSQWVGEYQHFSEPDCLQRSFTIIGSGTFTIEDSFSLIPSAQKVDFLVMNASVTPHVDYVRQQLVSSSTNSSDCGVGPWNLDQPKDITITGGCRLLGLVIPNIDLNMLRLEKDEFGNSVLHLGQDYQDATSGQQGIDPLTIPRPTSFQPGLIQCRKPEQPLQRVAPHATVKTPHHEKARGTTTRLSPHDKGSHGRRKNIATYAHNSITTTLVLLFSTIYYTVNQ